MSRSETRPPRGRVELYAGGFVVLLVAAYVLLRGNIQSSLRFVWLSIALSGVAAATAVVSVIIRREARSDPVTGATEPGSAGSADPGDAAPPMPGPAPPKPGPASPERPDPEPADE